MPRKFKVKKEERCTPELESLMSRFIPVFASTSDMRIIKDYGKIKKMLTEINCQKFRELQADKKSHKLMTVKMKEIQDLEGKLITTLQNR